MIRMSALALAVLTGLAVSTAEAQVCEGRPGPAAGNIALSAGYMSGNDASQMSVGITALGTSAYGGASIGSISYDDFSGSTTAVGASLGYQLALGTTGRAQICPFAIGEIGFGPSDINGSGIDASTRAFGAGLSWGFRATESAEFSLIPTISAGVAYSAVTLTDGVDDLTESDTFGQVRVGLGMVIAKRLAIVPSVIIPVGVEGADPMFGIALSLSVGARR